MFTSHVMMMQDDKGYAQSSIQICEQMCCYSSTWPVTQNATKQDPDWIHALFDQESSQTSILKRTMIDYTPQALVDVMKISGGCLLSIVMAGHITQLLMVAMMIAICTIQPPDSLHALLEFRSSQNSISKPKVVAYTAQPLADVMKIVFLTEQYLKGIRTHFDFKSSKHYTLSPTMVGYTPQPLLDTLKINTRWLRS